MPLSHHFDPSILEHLAYALSHYFDPSILEHLAYASYRTIRHSTFVSPFPLSINPTLLFFPKTTPSQGSNTGISNLIGRDPKLFSVRRFLLGCSISFKLV